MSLRPGLLARSGAREAALGWLNARYQGMSSAGVTASDGWPRQGARGAADLSSSAMSAAGVAGCAVSIANIEAAHWRLLAFQAASDRSRRQRRAAAPYTRVRASACARDAQAARPRAKACKAAYAIRRVFCHGARLSAFAA